MVTITANYIGKYQVVSQKIAKHLTNILNSVVSETERRRHGIVFKRSATLRRAIVYKIGVFGRGSFMPFKDLNEIIKPYMNKILKHMPYPIFIHARADFMSDLPKNPAPYYLIHCFLPRLR